MWLQRKSKTKKPTEFFFSTSLFTRKKRDGNIKKKSKKTELRYFALHTRRMDGKNTTGNEGKKREGCVMFPPPLQRVFFDSDLCDPGVCSSLFDHFFVCGFLCFRIPPKPLETFTQRRNCQPWAFSGLVLDWNWSSHFGCCLEKSQLESQ